MIKRYLNYPLLIDLIICLLVGTLIHQLRMELRLQLNLPQMDSIVKFMDLIVKVTTPLIGFLLTIVGVIVTFKNNFDTQSSKPPAPPQNINDPAIPPETNIFEKKISKKEQFYGASLHKQVMRVFLSAVYEFTIVVFLFVFLQSGLFEISRFWGVLLMSLGFLVIMLAMIRSLYIYRLFLNVHVD